MSDYSDRYVMTILKNGSVVLHDAEFGEIHRFPAGPRALWHALGVLAEWRERDEVRGGCPDHGDQCAGDPLAAAWNGDAPWSP